MTDRALRIGVVGVREGWSSEALADAVRAATGFRALIQLENCRADLSKRQVWCDGIELCALDAIIIKKVGASYNQDMLDRLEVLRFVHESGVPCFSAPERIIRLLDRLSCTVTLASGGIPIPETTITEDLEHAADTLNAYGQAVLKPLYSTKARGMVLVDARHGDLIAQVRTFRDAGNPVMYIQKKLNLPGRDLGILFLGGRHVGTYARVKGGTSWNTTTRDGGHYERHEASAEVVALAHRAQALFGLDMTSVDVVETDDGPKVFEVSAFGGFRGIRDALGIDAAKLYANYVVERVRA